MSHDRAIVNRVTVTHVTPWLAAKVWLHNFTGIHILLVEEFAIPIISNTKIRLVNSLSSVCFETKL